MAERQFGPYRLVRQVAVGGMAEIHLAKTKGIAGFEKYVALKMIHPNFAEDEQFIQMLVDEAKIAVQLNHANIAQTFDLGRVGDTYYITMEYVDGADLYKVLRRSSEIEHEMPLDVCAFIAKEIASALDHAHRKKDHTGKTLGIVHRDVSPQNVLISYAGEVKLVDFGIAKATMKARQTAVGVIKGKYYYMSPEQAWGEQIDYRSDIFSAGIVLYEMLTGQMLYLEEDLHRLLDMVRKADIAPPSTLRKGIPPQLERIVMHALAKERGDRYQSAGDFATDLERFLHTYSPVFTAAKVSTLVREIVGEPTAIPVSKVEERDGPIATHTLSTRDLILDKAELQDENSVIFRVADLKPKHPTEGARQKPKTGGVPAGPRVTRQADMNDLVSSAPKRAPIPALPRSHGRPASKPRDPDEHTREVGAAMSSGTIDDSGLLAVDSPAPPPAPSWKKRERDDATIPSDLGDDLANISDRTMISDGPPAFGGFLMENASEDGVDATVVSAGPPTDDTHEEIAPEDVDGEGGEEENPTIERDFRAPRPRVTARGAAAVPPPALAAKIHAPAVSELRKPRASRRTPGGGVPVQGNVLQAIVGAKPSEPMPAPRPAPPRSPGANAGSGPATGAGGASPAAGSPPGPGQPPAPSALQPSYTGYATDASGLPLETPPQGVPVGQPYYPPQPGYPPQGYPQYGGYPAPGYGQPVTPGALYQLQPHGAPPPQPMTLTGQMRLFEADELAPQYKVSGGPRWLKLAIASVIAVSLAAAVTFFIIQSTRNAAPTVGSVRVESVPPGAEVEFDGVRQAGTTPLTIDAVPVGTRHDVRVVLARHEPYTETVDIPKRGGEVPVKAVLEPITGKLRIVTQPDGADIILDGQLRGRAPMVISGIDMASSRKLELRLKDHEPVIIDLAWPANGEINLSQKLLLVR